ncbi:hypothetical protein J4464_03870 [Candidatus Woesearchaeota archaeon]|nr:hypothetical protein [Candidatus Woesearchaeota archaeon]
MATLDTLLASPNVDRSAHILTLSHLVICAQSPFVQIFPMASAAAKGFCDAAQIPLETAGTALLVAPTAIAGSFGMAAGVLSSDLTALQLDIDSRKYRKSSVAFGGGLYAATAAVCTVLGYGVGYGAYTLINTLGR